MVKENSVYKNIIKIINNIQSLYIEIYQIQNKL